jgi:hypothetical protein
VTVAVGLPFGRTFSALGGPDVLLVPACTTCAWTATSRASWITITAGAAGVGEGQVSYTVARNATAASRTGTILVAGQVFTVTQEGGAKSTDEAPFGAVDTPSDRATGVTGSIAVTGWALDDVEVARVRIYRDPVGAEPTGSPIFLGDAVMVDGARPDIARAHATRPFASRAGWGYLLLTNMLPNQGNGTFALSAYAEDREGHATLLGRRTITTTNRTAVKPFGAIDTPAQGETISGAAYINWGWALTPLPKAIAADGSTINVYIDGALVGPVTYNAYRADIATLFPGYANSVGPIGYRVIDTTQYANGLHTIAWVATDSAGASEGIGSRYFTIQNGPALTADDGSVQASGRVLEGSGLTAQGAGLGAPDSSVTMSMRRGYDEAAPFAPLARGEAGIFEVRMDALDRLELDLGASAALIGDLPVGASFDGRTGRFVWHPGPGFLGDHDLVFARGTAMVTVRVAISPDEQYAPATDGGPEGQ